MGKGSSADDADLLRLLNSSPPQLTAPQTAKLQSMDELFGGSKLSGLDKLADILADRGGTEV